MSYRINLHPSVENDLFEITEFIAAYAGLRVANLKVDEIIGFIGRLADFPKIGSIRSDVLEGMRAVPAGENAVVCFTVDDTTMIVTILCVSYAGSDWTTRTRKRR